MRTYRDKEDLKNEIRQSFEKYNSEFDTIPEALKDKRVPGVDRTPAENLAYQMDISRSTVQEIYESARRKIAACLVHGKPLHITGGNYRICGGQEAAHCGRCCRMQRANIEKSNRNCKGDSMMKIAVTYENGQIFQHFGHTEQFKL